MVGFIDEHRETFGVEPICAVLPIAPSLYYELKARERDPDRRPARARRDERLGEHIRRVWRENREVYGVRKVWKQLTARRAGRRPLYGGAADAAPGPRGRGAGAEVHGDDDPGCRGGATAGSGDAAVHRPTRPNQLWVADLTYVATWRGFVYVAFVIDVFSRRIVGWRASTSLRSDLALDALEQALYDRPIVQAEPLVHHSDRGVQPEFNWSSQHRLCEPIVEPHRAPRPVFASRGSFAAWC